jgi:hypothetical protein
MSVTKGDYPSFFTEGRSANTTRSRRRDELSIVCSSVFGNSVPCGFIKFILPTKLTSLFVGALPVITLAKKFLSLALSYVVHVNLLSTPPAIIKQLEVHLCGRKYKVRKVGKICVESSETPLCVQDLRQ